MSRKLGFFDRYSIGVRTTWILVAHRAGARLFLHTYPHPTMRVLQEVEFPQGRLKGGEILSDRPGRSYSSTTPERHAYSTETGVKQQMAKEFAGELAEILDQGRIQNQYDQLVIVAESKFLGFLLAALKPVTARNVVATLEKNLIHAPEKELPRHLKGILPFKNP